MSETQAYLEQQDVNNLFFIFAMMACILPVYNGFKKSKKQGAINTAIVVTVLFFYFSFPAVKTVIMILFVIYVIIGSVGSMLRNVF